MTEEIDDDYVVIIVGDENSQEIDIPIKQELEEFPTFSGSDLQFDQIQNYLQHNIKTEYNGEILNEVLDLSLLDDQNPNEFILEDYNNKIRKTKVNSLNKSTYKKRGKRKNKKLNTNKQGRKDNQKYLNYSNSEKKNFKFSYRWRRPDPETWKSKVEELLDKNPNMNEKDIVKTLAIEMMNIEPPELPENSYVRTKDGYRCNKCNQVKKNKGGIERHCQDHHGPRYLVCFACGADYRSKVSLYKHEKRCPAIDAPLVLKARAIQVAALLKPRNGIVPDIKIPPKNHYCPHCPEFFSMKASLQCHLVKHKREVNELSMKTGKEFKCKFCPFSFDIEKDLIVHKRMHWLGRPFQCPLCPKAYSSQTGLYRHSNTHKNRIFECDECNRLFKDKKTLICHMDTHSEPQFQCDECPKRYAQKAALLLHVHSKHRNLPPPFACTLCPKRFSRFFYLERHMMKKHSIMLMTKTIFIKRLPDLTEEEIRSIKIIDQAKIYETNDSVNFQLVPESQPHNTTKDVISPEKQENSVATEEKLNELENNEKSKNLENIEALKIVILDESEIDFDDIIAHQTNNKSSIIAIENGKIKPLSQEELEKYAEDF